MLRSQGENKFFTLCLRMGDYNRLMSNQNSIFNWIESELSPELCTSEKFIYNEMESQSGACLPVVYQPFNPSINWHWNDRGMIFDFLYSVNGEGKKLLDFGPGDGWPSLLVAPFAKEVVGVDSSEKRVETCTANAKRMGLNNVSFVSYNAGESLPFEDNSFDGIMAASSVEQTPDPKKTLEELLRVLKPGGRIRLSYEGLDRYKDGYENDIWIAGLTEETCKIILYKRDIENECALQYGLTVTMSDKELISRLSAEGEVIFEQITVTFLEEIRGAITKAQLCKTVHPSCKTWLSWMKEIGFSEVTPTYSGALAAGKLYKLYTEDNRPSDLDSVDEAIKPVVRVVTQLQAPIELDPAITAIK